MIIIGGTRAIIATTVDMSRPGRIGADDDQQQHGFAASASPSVMKAAMRRRRRYQHRRQAGIVGTMSMIGPAGPARRR
jgi:hypothetical protein